MSSDPTRPSTISNTDASRTVIGPPSSDPAHNKAHLVNPPENKTTTQKTGAALTSVSSSMDPFPHYLLAGLCGAGSYFAYTMKNPNAGLVAGGISLAYLLAGYKIQTGQVKTGYDIGSAASIALLLATGPHAMRTKEPYSVAMGTLGGVSTVGNLLKSYQTRTGRPKDMQLRYE